MNVSLRTRDALFTVPRDAPSFTLDETHGEEGGDTLGRGVLEAAHDERMWSTACLAEEKVIAAVAPNIQRYVEGDL